VKLILILIVSFGGFIASAETTKLPIAGFFEVALPAEDMNASKSFYKSLGYEVVAEQPWGMITLKRSDSRLTLLSKSFFKNITLVYSTSDLAAVVKALNDSGTKILEDDSAAEPARITIADPTGNEVAIYQE
jgi:predicted enzyme related to lactoylglutathione lyase